MDRIEEILEAVFKHGKNTPHISLDNKLPEDEMTIAKGIEELSAYVEKRESEVLREFVEWLIEKWDDKRVKKELYDYKNDKWVWDDWGDRGVNIKYLKFYSVEQFIKERGEDE